MITNPTVFDDRHLPRRLKHREAEVETLLRAWQPTGRGEADEDIVISGPRGVRKTALAHYTLDRVEAELGTRSACCLGTNPTTVLGRVLRDHPEGEQLAGVDAGARVAALERVVLTAPARRPPPPPSPGPPRAPRRRSARRRGRGSRFARVSG